MRISKIITTILAITLVSGSMNYTLDSYTDSVTTVSAATTNVKPESIITSTTSEKATTKIKRTYVVDVTVITVSTTTKAIINPTITIYNNPTKLGDPNGDGIINAIDASNILTVYTELATNTYNRNRPTKDERDCCDINKDGAINAVDASYVLSYYAYTATTKDKNKADIITYIRMNT